MGASGMEKKIDIDDLIAHKLPPEPHSGALEFVARGESIRRRVEY